MLLNGVAAGTLALSGEGVYTVDSAIAAPAGEVELCLRFIEAKDLAIYRLALR